MCSVSLNPVIQMQYLAKNEIKYLSISLFYNSNENRNTSHQILESAATEFQRRFHISADEADSSRRRSSVLSCQVF